VKTDEGTQWKSQIKFIQLNKHTLKILFLVQYAESCKTFHIAGKIDENEGTSLGIEIENLLSVTTIEQQLHILKDVSKFSSTIILQCSDCIKREGTFKRCHCKHQIFGMYA
jgi:hypothetical protein